MTDSVTDSHFLFVYGTLMRNAHHPQAQHFHQAATFLGPARWQGRLYLVSYYPGAVPSELTEDIVYGELWTVTDPQTLALLDQYEECSSRDPLPHEYTRSIETVWLGEQALNAWIYIYKRDTSGLKQIASGNFRSKSLMDPVLNDSE